MGSYRLVFIETYKNSGGGSSKSIRARPIAGQGLSTSMNVECSEKMRMRHPVGTRFVIRAKVTCREGGPDFLYSHFNSAYSVVSAEKVRDFMNDED